VGESSRRRRGLVAAPCEIIIEIISKIVIEIIRKHVDPVIASSIFLFGLAFGSFLNVCIYRLPRGLSVVTPRSACPECKQPIAFYDNLPVLSWLILGGRCRHCKTKITPRYLMIELLTGLLFLACYWYFGLTLSTLKYCVLAFLLLGLIFTDAETKLLPDKMTLPGLALGLIFSLLVPVNDLASQFLPGMVNLPISGDISMRILSLLDSVLGAAVGASFIYGAGAAYLRWRGTEGMGFGDVKLMAMVGAFLGIKLTVFTIFTASLAGSLFGVTTVLVVWLKRTHRFMKRLADAQAARRRGWQSAQVVFRNYQMPFGVFLGSMALIAFFFGNRFCTGTEGSGEDPDQPGLAASGGRAFLRDVRVPARLALHPRAAQEHYRRRRHCGRRFTLAGYFAAAPLQHGHPAAEAAET
jgi:leader peptidase (prepilin peptidase) / N-methyltransferase